jgi:hypothetical protein
MVIISKWLSQQRVQAEQSELKSVRRRRASRSAGTNPGALVDRLRLRTLHVLQRAHPRGPALILVDESLSVRLANVAHGSCYLRSAVLGGARTKPAHAAVRSESG